KDWVETGLLDMEASDARNLEVMNYSVTQGQIVEKGRFEITKKDEGDWSSPKVVPFGKQLSQDKISSVINELSDMKIAAVRKKPDSLIELLSGKSKQLTPDSQMSLQEKGFYLTQNGILGDEGQFILKKYNGVNYIVIFGVGFNDESLQVSTTKEGDKEKKDESQKATGRYMFINASFDEKFNPEPKIPAEPKEPAPDASEEIKKKYNEDFKNFNKAKADHEMWAKTTKAAKDEVQKLEKRFNDWYYVIDNESYEKVKVTFADLVEEKPEAVKETNPNSLSQPKLPTLPQPN
ncbi:MAG: DUF4340 domain-containing protein, partial [Lentisphaeraceae bacterium]|nr:DUF4340 domain-containing protein [Lentisphaeraceae bacterium]